MTEHPDDADRAPTAPRLVRLWVAGFLSLLLVFGLGGLELWPFTSWYMFSHVEPRVIRVAVPVAVLADGRERVLDRTTLPLGLLSHRLRRRLESSVDETCAALLRAVERFDEVREVRVYERRWDPLVRNGDRPADVVQIERARCA